MSNNGSSPLVLWYNQLGMNDVDRVGGKNASLGEMITNLSGMGVSVPNGFATTADAFNQFLDQSGVNQRIYELLDETDIDDVSALAKAGAQIRQWIIDTPFQSELEDAIRDAYTQLSADNAEASFAVRFLRHGGRYAGCLLRRAARDIPQRAGLRCRARRGEARVCFAV